MDGHSYDGFDGKPRSIAAAPEQASPTTLWARHAADGLRERHPLRSARSGLQKRQWTALAALVGLLALLFLTDSGIARIFAITLVTATFGAMIALRVAASIVAPKCAQGAVLPDALLPRASLIVAAYREAAVMPQLIQALERIDYPADRLDIKLALEADDEETLDALRAMSLDARFEIVRVPDGAPRTKPRALNYALRFCRGDIVGVLDAEDRPHPRQLRTAVECFTAGDASLACLQAPLNWYNRDDCWLTRQFALEYASHFNALLPLYARMGWPLPLGGTSNYIRTSALRRAGGWDAYNVTEDADLGFRLAQHGYRSDVIDLPTLEEAPVRTAPWIKQRSRWLKGYMQTLAVHARSHIPPAPLILTLGVSVISAMAHAPLAAACLLWIVPASGFEPPGILAAGFLTSGYLAAMICAATGMRRAGYRPKMSDLMTMPMYWPLQTLAAVRALFELLTKPYHWAKTEHGLRLYGDTKCNSR